MTTDAAVIPCPQCKQPLPAEAKACENCGARRSSVRGTYASHSRPAAIALQLACWVFVINIISGVVNYMLAAQAPTEQLYVISLLVFGLFRILVLVFLAVSFFLAFRGIAQTRDPSVSGGGQALTAIVLAVILSLFWIVSVVVTVASN